MEGEFVQAVAIGFAAQMVDGALGMAYGLIATSFLIALGYPPAQASAMTHLAELVTTGASGVSHALHGNVDWSLVKRLAPAGVAGGVLGVVAVTRVPAEVIKPIVAVYLAVMGVVVLFIAVKGPRPAPKPEGVARLGLVGGFLDASGGGGWGPIVATTLLGKGQPPRRTIGSVSASEFAVTLVVSAAFVLTLGRIDMASVAGLMVGGVLAAPLAGLIVKHAQPRHVLVAVGLLITAISAWQIADLVRAPPAALTGLFAPAS